MSREAQKVVVVQDASRDVSSSAILGILHDLTLKPGDDLTLLGVLHQINSSSEPESPSGRNCQEKGRVLNNAEILQICKHCEMEKIGFHIRVLAGASPKAVALKAVKVPRLHGWYLTELSPPVSVIELAVLPNLNPNPRPINTNTSIGHWASRQMKKDKKYFMDKLSCGISRMKRDNTIEELRGPVTTFVSYGEMMHGSLEELLSCRAVMAVENPHGITQENLHFLNPHRVNSSFWQSSVSSSSLQTLNPQVLASTRQDIPLGLPSRRSHYKYRTRTAEEQSASDQMSEFQPEEIFRNSSCTVCKNRRPKIGWKKDFTYAELQAATEGFASENFLSEGGFGPVYGGQLKNGLKIAVKQHKHASFQGEKEFKSEVTVLSKARHENVVMLLGSCSEGNHRLLVYEFVCNGSLDQHLSKHSCSPLGWKKRIKIALGTAKGDFGLARTQQEDSDHSSETRVVGTLGYVAPEYAESGKASKRTDVYSFGVVLLQLITGLETTDKELKGKSLVEWARPLLKEGNYPDLIDKRIVDSHDVHQLLWMVRVAEKCLSKDPHKRLPMENVVDALCYIMGGNTCYSIKGFSPGLSDSVSNHPESPESQGECRATEKKALVQKLQGSVAQFR
ncbi:Inactive protein kinase [Vitis vinifera]|uniref:Inactive protein kinase n=1 Tax=Vitis vinifera TaxID=29760 RepID=A0A438IBC5_VITVI|nr:Inactive protein kinase [Vitis vinifera]